MASTLPFTFIIYVFFLVSQCPTGILAAQNPLILPAGETGADDWNLEILPNITSTGNIVFDTVSSLLQHWPNVRHHSGHTIVPATLPVGTLLYHGRNNGSFPASPEWASTDPEFARLFCVDAADECWLLTLVVTRPLRALYFDGNSAIKMPDGPMDTQDLLVWGEVLPERATLEWEYERLRGLCDLGRELGLDAFIRMNLKFEVMLCDFTDGVEIASFSKLETEPTFPHHGYSFIQSSTWHDRPPGETRIQLDLSHLISLYDVALAPSLVSQRLGKQRHEHRVLGIAAEDIDAVMHRLRTMQKSPSESGINWSSLFQVIIDRYAQRLEVLQSTLKSCDDHKRAFRILRTMLMPYLLHFAVPPHTTAGNSWAAPIFRQCAQTHTSFMSSLESKLTASERLLRNAVEETNREICRTLVRMWASGVVERLSGPALLAEWKTDVDRLMAWLDWSAWTTCRPSCAIDESCYLPGAPFSMDEWNNTSVQPKCVRVFEPYTYTDLLWG
ncbi:hypothetical protein C8J57DRAFT_1175054 [Mycena rebaudengoi]|nr:hypothetical protein C8J57DRAFT_1175054 [Mycena rebaudengoi]